MRTAPSGSAAVADRWRTYIVATLAVLSLSAAVTAPTAADADADLRAFDVPGQSFQSALIALAVQANVSIGRSGEARCAARAGPLLGRYTLTEALERLLKGTGCSYRMIDASTVLIFGRPKPMPAKPAKTSAPAEVLDQDVVVTASRRRETIDLSPYDVTRAGREELAVGRIHDTGELASLVPGMTVTNLGPGRDKIILRGLSDGIFTGRTQSTVSLYLDDVPLTYNAADPDLRLIDVEAVEVLQGPQGVLYGAGSIGGVVHIITRKPDLEAYSGSLDVTASLTQSGSPSTAVDGVVNLPLLQDRLGLRIAAYREVSGGYIDDPKTARSDVNETVRQGARVQAVLELSPTWRATLGGVYQSIASKDTQYGVGGLPAYTRDNLLPEPHDNDFDEVSLVLEGGPELAVQILHEPGPSRCHHSITTPQMLCRSLRQAWRLWRPFVEADRKNLVSEEINLASSPLAKTQWIAGLFALNDEEHSVSRLTDVTDSVSSNNVLYGENRSDVVNEFAAYGEVTYPLPARFFLTLGGRLFQSREYTGSIVSVPSAKRSLDGKTFDQGLAPKAVLRFNITPRAMVYLQAAEGYRSGGLNTSALPTQTFGLSPGGQQPFQRYAGDQLWNYELGAKAALFQSRLSVRACVFYDRWDNIQTDQIQSSGLPYTANVGDGVNQGVEIEAVYQPTPNVVIRANGVINDPELVNKAPGFAALPDASLPGVSSGLIRRSA